MHAALMTLSLTIPLPHWAKWEADLDCTFTTEERNKILQNVQKASCCVRYQESSFKILTRWYRTLQTLKKMFPVHSDRCWRCGDQEGSLRHIFWSCRLIRPFWDSIRLHLTRFTDRLITNDAAFFLLHHKSIPTYSYQRLVLPHMLNAARTYVAESWKQKPPSVSMCLRKVNAIGRVGI